VHAWMKCFDAAVHHLRKTCYFRDVADVDTGVAQSFCSTARADDFNVEAIEYVCEVYDARFVGDADECSSDRLKFKGHTI